MGYVGTGHGNFSLYNPLDPDPNHHACSIIEESIATNGTLPSCYPNPRGITVDYSGNVYVVDTIGRQIQKFDSNGHFIKRWGSYGGSPGQFSLPWDIASNSNGNVYVADIGSHRIQKFSNDGAPLLEWGQFSNDPDGKGIFDSPGSIAVDPIRHFVYVSDGYDRIQKFDSNGGYITQWGNRSIGDWGLAVDSNGNVYSTYYLYDSVSKFDSNWHLITKWGTPGSGDGHFGCSVNLILPYCYPAGPQGIAVDHKGHVYVVDTVNNRVEIFASDGHFLTAWVLRAMELISLIIQPVLHTN